MTVQNKKTNLELTKKHLEKIAKSKRTKHRDILQVVKYSDGNKATATDSCRALVIQYENETFGDSFDNIHSLTPMTVEKYPNVERVIPKDEQVPNTLKLEHSMIKEILRVLRDMKKLKIENIMINLIDCTDFTECYLESKKTNYDEVETDSKLYIGSIEKIESEQLLLNTDYFLNMIQFIKDTKENTVLKFGGKFMPIVFENTLADKFTYQYILCPVRGY